MMNVALQTIETCPVSGEVSIRIDSYGRTSNDGAMVGGILRHDLAGPYFRTADGSDGIEIADIFASVDVEATFTCRARWFSKDTF